MDMVLNVPHHPQPGETVLGKSLACCPGGKGANQAFAVGRLGGSVRMIGCIGADENGQMLVANLKKANVDTSEITVIENEPTGLAVITVDENAENCITVLSGANFCLTPEFIRQHETIIAESDYIITQLETPVDTVVALAKMAKAYGKCMILDPAPARSDLPDELFPLIEVIKPNETELQILTGKKTDTAENIEKAASCLLAKGVSKVVVTLGDKGAALVDTEGIRFFEGEKVQPVDTTAAGDTFTAAFVSGMAEGMAMEEAIVYANRVASIVVTRAGAQTSIPGREEVKKMGLR
jgi:ribokinase